MKHASLPPSDWQTGSLFDATLPSTRWADGPQDRASLPEWASRSTVSTSAAPISAAPPLRPEVAAPARRRGVPATMPLTPALEPSIDAGAAPLPLVPREGLPVLHLFYRLNRSVWESLPASERAAGKVRLEEILTQARERQNMQVAALSMIAAADLAFVVVGHDLHLINALEKRLASALGPDVLSPVYQYFSLTEKPEHLSTEEEYLQELAKKEGVRAGHPEFEKKRAAFREQARHSATGQMHPKLPEWEFFCFYPIRQRRDPGANWYALDAARRRELMTARGKIGEEFSGRVWELVTASAGIDDWEWGVTLFAHDPADVKAMASQARFDTVAQQYTEFGPCYIGMPLPLPAIYERLGM